IEKGRMIESGTHDELVAREGRYFEMLQVQLHAARDYAGAEGEPGSPAPLATVPPAAAAPAASTP
ncbi:MAG: hypothetical protein ACT4PL_07995, partial [Phycisphaerales bacterium]